jgi:hypothetical protein
MVVLMAEKKVVVLADELVGKSVVSLAVQLAERWVVLFVDQSDKMKIHGKAHLLALT